MMNKIKIDWFKFKKDILLLFIPDLIVNGTELTTNFSKAILDIVNTNKITMDKISNSVFYINTSNNSIFYVDKAFYYTIIKQMLFCPIRLNFVEDLQLLYLDYYTEV